MKDLTLIQLNELNFDIVKKYIERNPKKLKTFSYLVSKFNYRETHSEKEYKLLEPWIQWVSAYTGKDAKDHSMFHIGDTKNLNKETIFDYLEKKNIEQGMISPMNFYSDSKKYSYFISDPWIKNDSYGDIYLDKISIAMSNIINNNSIKNQLSLAKSYLWIIFSILKYAKISNYFLYIKLIVGSISKKWFKPLLLDLLLSDIHLSLRKQKKIEFTSIFLNAGAHIQHHYLINSIENSNNKRNPKWYLSKNDDPFKDMLLVYEVILKNIVLNKGKKIVATGLTQKLFKNPIYYYRLNNHEDFLKKIDISFKNVNPRMSRDFLITFDKIDDLINCKKILSSIFNKKKNKRVFEILDSVSETELFVSLTYPYEIKKSSSFINLSNNEEIKIFKDVSFVAIKNADHDQKGFLFTDLNKKFLKKNFHIKDIKELIESYYET